ncbi:MAG: acetamidase/formamidase family protein [Oscillospiraceae bacterium]|nr:acetamidase/formamidase family protein [Oscillospiraceae bacterium]
MLRINRNDVIYSMSPHNKPVAAADNGAVVVFETYDCFEGQVTSENHHLGAIDWEHINPATGPLYINSAAAGDILKVEILDIKIDAQCAVCEAPSEGITGLVMTDEATKILPVRGENVLFNDKISLPVKPMIGVIGTAPANVSIPTGTPGEHGGNMDCKRIGKGTVLYLPVNVDGALLAMGDLHAIMGDGEVCVCGAEVNGEVTIRVEVLKGCLLPLPFLVTQNKFMTICSEATVDEAAVRCTLKMREFLTNALGMDEHTAGMLLSLCGDVRICQAVDPQKTCRMEVPTFIADSYGYRFP